MARITTGDACLKFRKALTMTIGIFIDFAHD
jgi:hypothetical protein